MIDVSAIEELVTQYAHHGWKLERILIARDLSATADTDLNERFGSGVVRNASIDAIWFSRPNGDKVSWEIRRLSATPFALVRFVHSDATAEERDEILRSAEIEIESTLRAAPTEH